MKACLISHSSSKDGAERSLLELVEALTSTGTECYVLLPQEGALADELRKYNVAFSVIPYCRWMARGVSGWKRCGRFILNLFMVVPVALAIKRRKCDIIYSNTITVCIGAFASCLLGLPHIWHIRELGYRDHKLTFDLGKKFSLWIMNRLSQACIASSHTLLKEFQQYFNPAKLRLVYNWVKAPEDAQPGKGACQNNGRIKCIIIGRLEEGKGQEDAVLAIKELLVSEVRAELKIVGESNSLYGNYLRSLVKENKLTDCIEFCGYRDDPLFLMRESDITLVCSRAEAFGRVAVEAMKLGRPVIGAGSSGTAEIIQDGFNGLIYTPGDYRGLAEKIRYLAENPGIAERLADSGKYWAQRRFNKEGYGRQIRDIFMEFTRRQAAK
jgi:glycosyltransferase involved in cell wall biosynthesis